MVFDYKTKPQMSLAHVEGAAAAAWQRLFIKGGTFSLSRERTVVVVCGL